MSLKKDLSKYSPRKQQQEAIDFIDQQFKKNYEYERTTARQQFMLMN